MDKLAMISLEMLDAILSMASIPSLLRLSATSKSYFLVVHEHINRRLSKTINPFFEDHVKFVEILKRSTSVVSGSLALSFMVPPYQENWKANDMDIYTNLHNVFTLTAYMQFCGYRKDGGDKLIKDYDDIKGNRMYGEVGGISHVIHMRKNDKKVDVIVSKRKSPIYPIFFFHTTIVQNFISGQGFFSAYPNLTDKGKALVNPMSFWPKREPTKTVGQCVLKYGQRGFDIGLTIYDIGENVNHKCRSSYNCPHTTRTTIDPGCLYVSFGTRLQEIGEKMLRPRIYNSGMGLTWNMGGSSCDDTYTTMKPSVYCTGHTS